MSLIVPSVLFLSLCTGALGSGPVVPCNRPLFQTQLQVCLSHFNSSMEQTEYRSNCVWPEVKGFYNVLKLCVEGRAKDQRCNNMGSLTDDFYLEVHRTYFQECGRVQDPSVAVVILMVVPLVVSTVMLPMFCAHLTTDQQ